MFRLVGHLRVADVVSPYPETAMNSNDTPVGAGLLVVALLILWYVSGFPPAPGQPYNAALFPGIAAGGLGLAAIGLIISGMKQKAARRQDAPRTTNDLPAAAGGQDVLTGGKVDGPETAKTAPRLLAILLTAGAVGFYIVAAKFLGFIITGTIVLAVLMWAYGVKIKVLIPVAIIATAVIHLAFYKLLSVPLPWGLLTPFAW